LGDGDSGGGAMIPCYIRDIDKRRPVVIINQSYFGEFIDLPIDKIEHIVLKLKVKEARACYYGFRLDI
jgi:hypothetical protein